MSIGETPTMSERVPELLPCFCGGEPVPVKSRPRDKVECSNEKGCALYIYEYYREDWQQLQESIRAHADAEKAEAVREALERARTWTSQQRLDWVREERLQHGGQYAVTRAGAKASAYSNVETYLDSAIRALADKVKP